MSLKKIKPKKRSGKKGSTKEKKEFRLGTLDSPTRLPHSVDRTLLKKYTTHGRKFELYFTTGIKAEARSKISYLRNEAKKTVDVKIDPHGVYAIYTQTGIQRTASKKPKPDPLPRQRKFKVGHITRVFEASGKYASKARAEEAAKKIGDRYYFRYTKIKVVDYADPKRVQLWKSQKPEWKS